MARPGIEPGTFGSGICLLSHTRYQPHCTNGLELFENPSLFQGKGRILEI